MARNCYTFSYTLLEKADYPVSGFRAHIWGVVLLGSLLSQAVLAQDSHYWNLHYGTQSTLLGGAVIGSVADLSAAFYNPGWLGLRRE
ncbi:MAG: hypothetical protein KAJ12_14040, partial [Bacteroidetes bacterium]|nr:hypothetical protein [Bacteroidota bacterium]